MTGKTLTKWETDIDTQKKGKSYQLNKMQVRSYLGKYHLSHPQTGSSIEDIQDGDSTTDDEEQLTLVSVLAVQQLDILYSCVNCNIVHVR